MPYLIPRYEEIFKTRADRTIKGPLSWFKMCADLNSPEVVALTSAGRDGIEALGVLVLLTKLCASKRIDDRDGVIDLPVNILATTIRVEQTQLERSLELLTDGNHLVPIGEPNGSHVGPRVCHQIRLDKTRLDKSSSSSRQTETDHDLLQGILDEYREKLPKLPQPRAVPGKKHALWPVVRARLRDEGREAISEVFSLAAQMPFIRGDNDDWRASLGWLMKPKNFEKVITKEYTLDTSEPAIHPDGTFIFEDDIPNGSVT